MHHRQRVFPIGIRGVLMRNIVAVVVYKIQNNMNKMRDVPFKNNNSIRRFQKLFTFR